MGAEPLFYTSDFTVSGNRVTLLVTPTPGRKHVIFYSYLMPGGTTHAHAREEKDDWTAGNTWDLGQVPDLNEIVMYRGSVSDGVFLWVAYGAATSKSLRRALLTGHGLTLTWDTAAISGFTNDAGEIVTKMWAHPTDIDNVYIGTKNTAGTIRLYHYDGVTLAVVYTHAAFPTVTFYQITGITGARNSTKVWFTLGQYDNILTADANNADCGVYKSTNGTTFAYVGSTAAGSGREGNGTAGERGLGMFDITYDESTARLWTCHKSHSGLWTSPAGSEASFSDDDGATWTDCDTNNNVNEKDSGGIQGMPGAGPFTDMYFQVHRNFAGSGDVNLTLHRHHSTNPTAATPTFDNATAGSGAALGPQTYGGHLYSDATKMIRPEADGVTGSGYRSTDSGANVTEQAADWWTSEDGAIRPGGFTVHWTLPYFVAVRDSGVDLRITTDGGVTWADLVLPGLPQGAAFVQNIA